MTQHSICANQATTISICMIYHSFLSGPEGVRACTPAGSGGGLESDAPHAVAAVRPAYIHGRCRCRVGVGVGVE